jgi:PAS domain S-box-containing protein
MIVSLLLVRRSITDEAEPTPRRNAALQSARSRGFSYCKSLTEMDAPDYKLLFDSAPGLYVVLDPQLRIVAASDAYLRATMTRRDEVLGKALFEVFPANTQDPHGNGESAVRQRLERVLAERTRQTLALQRYDLRPPEASGKFVRRYWNAVFTPLPGPDGAVRHIWCVVEDVTDRAHDARLRKVLNVDVIGVIFFDRSGTLISANDTFLRWSGYTHEDLAAGRLTWQALTPPEFHEASLAELERVRTTGRIGPYEKEYIGKNGERRWMLFVGGQLDDGTVVEYLLDMSARKAAERAQRQSEERYRMLFDSIDSGFCVLELIYDSQGRPADYRFLEVNPAFERQTGLKDATAKTMREHVPDHEQHWFDTYARVAETGESVRFVQEAKPLMGGWYEVFAFRVGGAGSRKVGVLFNDITARMRAEIDLQDAARRKDEFLATLAHELRNPLAPIRNAVSILQLRQGIDGELAMVSQLIDRQVRHLVRLVDDLLDVSRITFGKVQLQKARVDLREVAREAVATSEPQLAAASHRLSLELGHTPVWVDADRVRLAQVISNLLNNAARYTPAGGSIALEIARDGAEARVAVQDNGIGIDPALLERVFEPFTQIERPDGASAGGIGIGLTLAKALVDLHGGRIWAQSAGPGAGSRFVVCLPAAAAPRAEAAGKTWHARAAPRRLLLVDDNVDATSSQAALLRLLGHEVETAYSGQAALDKVQSFRPDIVLLDIGMPGMDGLEVARRLRATPLGREVKLVAQTGWGQDEDRRRTREAGFDAHLAKPVDMDALMKLL